MIRDSLVADIQLLMIAIDMKEFDLAKILMKSIRRQLTHTFKKDMPRKYWIFYQQPKIYFLSNTLCLEFPSWGSEKYRKLLIDLGRKLRAFCITDISYFDGKTTFAVRGAINDFDYEGTKK